MKPALVYRLAYLASVLAYFVIFFVFVYSPAFEDLLPNWILSLIMIPTILILGMHLMVELNRFMWLALMILGFFFVYLIAHETVEHDYDSFILFLLFIPCIITAFCTFAIGFLPKKRS